jgi:hypothetical protein
MQRILLSVALIIIMTFSLSADDDVKTFDFLGVKKCMICHKGEKKGMVYEVWQKSKHSQAFQVLVDLKDSSDKNADCLKCHTTGFGTSGYNVGAENASKFEGVQCEMCHGAGSGFKLVHPKNLELAATKGFNASPKVETCQVCHNDKTQEACGTKKFVFEEAVKVIDHNYRDKE